MKSFFRSNRLTGSTFLALLALPLVASAPALPRRLVPVEECGRDPGFQAFRQKLTQAVTKNDRDAFLQLLAPDVLADFGGRQGRGIFAEHIDNAGGELWMELEQVVRLGCARSGKARIIPSLTVQAEPWVDEDPDFFIVAMDGAKLRKTADLESGVIATLKWDTGKLIAGWDFQSEVQFGKGRRGWLHNHEFMVPAGYRFFIEKRDEQWMVTALVAGD